MSLLNLFKKISEKSLNRRHIYVFELEAQMEKRVISNIFVFTAVMLLTIGFVSAGWFDFFNKAEVTGNVVNGVGVEFEKASASYSQSGYPVTRSVDKLTSRSNGWAVYSKPSTAVYEISSPISVSESGNELKMTFNLYQNYGKYHNLGKFRISVTNADKELFADGKILNGQVGDDSIWTIVSPVNVTSKNGATLTVQEDGSILASGVNPAVDVYTIVLKTNINAITGIRLEALEDSSFKTNGPGRASSGNFVLNEINLDVEEVRGTSGSSSGSSGGGSGSGGSSTSVNSSTGSSGGGSGGSVGINVSANVVCKEYVLGVSMDGTKLYDAKSRSSKSPYPICSEIVKGDSCYLGTTEIKVLDSYTNSSGMWLKLGLSNGLFTKVYDTSENSLDLNPSVKEYDWTYNGNYNSISQVQFEVCQNISVSSCIDSDGGENYFVKGYTNSTWGNNEDFCRGQIRLSEFVCNSDGDTATNVEYTCWNRCIDGACVYELDEVIKLGEGQVINVEGNSIYKLSLNYISATQVKILVNEQIVTLGLDQSYKLAEGNYINLEDITGDVTEGHYAHISISKDPVWGDKDYEILGESYGYGSPGNLLEVGGKLNFDYSISVEKKDIDKLPQNLTKQFVHESGESISIFMPLTQIGECYYDDYNKISVCYKVYSSEVKFDKEGIYKFSSSEGFYIKVVPKGTYNKILINDSSVKVNYLSGHYNFWQSADYYSAMYDMDENSNEYSNQRYSWASVSEFKDKESALRALDSYISYGLVNVKRVSDYGYAYMSRSEWNGGTSISIIWVSGNKLIRYDTSDREGVTSGVEKLNTEQVIDALTGKNAKFKDAVEYNEFSPKNKQLISKYLTKYKSSVTGKEVDCVSRWECSVNPVICPEHGTQTKVCEDLNKCGETYRAEVACTPGICSGCQTGDNGRCVPYGTRMLQGDNPMFCDVTGRFEAQKGKLNDGSWAACQNNYECESNFCSGGECIEINDAIGQAKGMKGLFVKALCRMANLFDKEGYNSCIVEYVN